MKVEWRPVRTHPGLYEVSSMGRVRSLERECVCRSRGHRLVKSRILYPTKHSRGFLAMSLFKEGKRSFAYVHKLVADAFLTRPEHAWSIAFKDGDKRNCAKSNLQWLIRKGVKNASQR